MCQVIIFLFSHDLVGSDCVAVMGLCGFCLCLGTDPQDQLALGALLQVNFTVVMALLWKVWESLPFRWLHNLTSLFGF